MTVEKSETEDETGQQSAEASREERKQDEQVSGALEKTADEESRSSSDLPNPLPMFPLGSVLFPGQILPLHVFEPRYKEMMAHCLGEDDAGDKLFGVVLIERGSEVGGGDVRTDVGTVARIVSHRLLDGGRMAVLAVGERRIKISEWLEDDPYPQAIADTWPCEDKESLAGSANQSRLTAGEEVAGEEIDETSAAISKAGLFASAEAVVRRVWALRREMGAADPEPAEEFPRTSVGSYGLAARIPLQQFDRQKLLAAPSVAERLSLLEEILTDHEELLLARLSTS